MAFRFEGYVIVSADGMLADANNAMPDSLKYEADQEFFSRQLDQADLVVHGRGSFEDHPNSPRRKRIILTRSVTAVAADPSQPNATLWNPAGTSFELACETAGVNSGTIAIIGGPVVFAMFADRYDTFFLSQASNVRLGNGRGVFPGVPEQTPQAILGEWGLAADRSRVLDAANDVSVTPWRRQAAVPPI